MHPVIYGSALQGYSMCRDLCRGARLSTSNHSAVSDSRKCRVSAAYAVYESMEAAGGEACIVSETWPE